MKNGTNEEKLFVFNQLTQAKSPNSVILSYAQGVILDNYKEDINVFFSSKEIKSFNNPFILLKWWETLRAMKHSLKHDPLGMLYDVSDHAIDLSQKKVIKLYSLLYQSLKADIRSIFVLFAMLEYMNEDDLATITNTGRAGIKRQIKESMLQYLQETNSINLVKELLVLRRMQKHNIPIGLVISNKISEYNEILRQKKFTQMRKVRSLENAKKCIEENEEHTKKEFFKLFEAEFYSEVKILSMLETVCQTADEILAEIN